MTFQILHCDSDGDFGKKAVTHLADSINKHQIHFVARRDALDAILISYEWKTP